MLPIRILSQPTDVTCGPTSLHAIYQYYGEKISLDKVINQVRYVEGGGTLAVMLACHALKRGYKTKMFTYNLRMFDPTWFNVAPDELNPHLIEKLKAQRKHTSSKKMRYATTAYLEYLELGGNILFQDLTPQLLMKYFKKQVPILAGLSSTYLYQCAREISPDDYTTIADDVRGKPSGHFVVLCGYDEVKGHVVVADPYSKNPLDASQYYSVKVSRLINSIMLGILTYDANFLVVEKSDK